MKTLRLKKKEDRRIRAGHPWIFSNEVDTTLTPLKQFTPGEEVLVQAHDQTVLGVAYVNPHSLITGRLFTSDPNQRLDLAFFQEKLANALALRTRLFDQPYYRLVFGESDELPGLVVDRFGDHLVMQINTAGMEQKQTLIATALTTLLPNTLSILLRNDSAMREHEGLEKYVRAIHGTPPEEITLEENGITFSLPLKTGQKTGWFYDHRMNRARLAAYVKNQSVLDVFSYLGAWGIQAAKYGATHVDFIEASAPACAFIQKNITDNKLEDRTTILCNDAFDALKELQHANKQYDVIVLDPPAFVKKFKDRKEGILAYQRINEAAIKLLAPNGILITCSCSMHVGLDDLMQMLQRVAFRTSLRLQVLEYGHQGPDHPIHVAIPETNYLKAIIVRKLS